MSNSREIDVATKLTASVKRRGGVDSRDAMTIRDEIRRGSRLMRKLDLAIFVMATWIGLITENAVGKEPEGCY